jgi:hypothetical protein
MKAKEFIYNLRTIFEDAGSELGKKTDQHLMYMLDSARAVLAGQKMDKRKSVEQMAQYVDVTPTIVPLSEIGTVGDTRVLKLVIPQPIRYGNGEAIFTVGPTDGRESFTEISYSQLRTVLYRKYTASSPKWFWLEGSIYIINSDTDSRSKIRVRGIFSEPYLVEQAMNRYKYLTPFNWDYPLNLNDAKAVYQIAFSGDMGWGDTAMQAVSLAESKQQQAEQNADRNAQGR